MKAVTTRRPARVRGVLILGRDGRWRGYVPAIPGLAVAAEAPELAEAALRDAVAEATATIPPAERRRLAAASQGREIDLPEYLTADAIRIEPVWVRLAPKGADRGG